MKRWLPTDWQDAQRLILGSIGAGLFFYGLNDGDIDALVGRIQKASNGALIVWAILVKEPPRSRSRNSGESPNDIE